MFLLVKNNKEKEKRKEQHVSMREKVVHNLSQNDCTNII